MNTIIIKNNGNIFTLFQISEIFKNPAHSQARRGRIFEVIARLYSTFRNILKTDGFFFSHIQIII